MRKAIFITEMPKNCYNCPYCDESGGDGDWWCNLQGQYLPFADSESEERDLCCPLRPYQETIPIEWIKKWKEKAADGSLYRGPLDLYDRCEYEAAIDRLLSDWEEENEID